MAVGYFRTSCCRPQGGMFTVLGHMEEDTLSLALPKCLRLHSTRVHALHRCPLAMPPTQPRTRAGIH